MIVAALLASGPLLLFGFLDAEPAVVRALALLWVIAVLWITEAIHITLTALLVPILAVALDLLTVPDAMASFGHPIIFLFLGGFALASAMHVQQLDLWLADSILGATGGRLGLAVISLAAATAALSMWISNTAVTAMMLPLILGLLSKNPSLCLRTQAFALLAIAYSANIGGIGTLVGSPPNALVAAQLQLSFVEWLSIGMPVVIVLWPLMMATLWGLMRPDFLGSRVSIEREPMTWTRERRTLIAIFALTVTGWLLGQPLSGWLGVDSNFDTWVAITALVAIGATRVASWKQIEQSTEWGVLLLFGGGLALSAVLQQSDASAWLGLNLAELIGGWPLVFLLGALLAFVVFLTEVSSNTATTALLVPVFLALPAGLVDPSLAALAVGVAASCAFMLPVATPPNALVHGTGRVSQGTMMRAGVFLNLLAIGALTLIFLVIKTPSGLS